MRAGVVAAVVARDLKLVFREKETLFWLFLFPLLLLTGYVALFTPHGGGAVTLRVALVPLNDSYRGAAATAMKYLSEINASEGSSVTVRLHAGVRSSLPEALCELRKGRLDAVVLVGRNVTIYLLVGEDTVKAELARSMLEGFFREAVLYESLGRLTYLAEKLASGPQRKEAEKFIDAVWSTAKEPPVRVVEVVPGGLEKRRLVTGWMTLSVVFMGFMFGGVLGGAEQVAGEIRRGFALRLFSTSITPGEYYSGTTISWLLTMALSAAPTLLLGVLVYGGRLAGVSGLNGLAVAALILLAELLSYSVGALIGLFVKSESAAGVIANLVIWPTMIAGGFWMPREMLPRPLQAFAAVNPFSQLFYAATRIAVYGDPPLAHLGEALAAGLAALLLYAAAAVLYGRRLPRLLEEV